MLRPPDNPPLTGPDDTAESPAALRLHQVAVPFPAGERLAGHVLAGFNSDEGVRRNHGRPGAAGGPGAIREQLGRLAAHGSGPLYDAGDVICTGGDLEGAQRELGGLVSSILDTGAVPVVLGGGHEVALGTYLGIAAHLASHPEGHVRLAVVNLDAHLDLRDQPQASSGTPFLEMSRAAAGTGAAFSYFCLGIARASNTAALLQTAAEIGATYLEDTDLESVPAGLLSGIIGGFDRIYLSVDLDVLPGSVMPAVSAPAALGVSPAVVLKIIERLARSGKLIAADFAELNPLFDRDHQGARLAARLVHSLLGTI